MWYKLSKMFIVDKMKLIK